MEENQLRFELHRYLGWAGQAPSYRIGHHALRGRGRGGRAGPAAGGGGGPAAARAPRRAGQDFDLRDFHDRALAVGSLPLDVLREVLAG
jgi:hypothetical protein